MQQLINGVRYLFRNPDEIGQLFIEHLLLTAAALGIALLIAIPLGLLVARVRWLQVPVLNILSVIYTIPSLALLVLLIPLFGLGFDTALVALVAYAQLVLVRNIVVGLTTIEPSVIEAAKGVGMNGWQRFSRVELPLALPLVLAGTRVAALSIIGIGTIAGFVNAGGLGELLFEGAATSSRAVVAGSIAIALLALVVNLLLRTVERRAALALGVEV